MYYCGISVYTQNFSWKDMKSLVVASTIDGGGGSGGSGGSSSTFGSSSSSSSSSSCSSSCSSTIDGSCYLLRVGVSEFIVYRK